jgi:hypothetical protein
VPIEIDGDRFWMIAIAGLDVDEHLLDLGEAHPRSIAEHRQFVAIAAP